MGEFPSGQRGQTVNLLLIASVVRIHLPPPTKSIIRLGGAFCWFRCLGGWIRTHFIQQSTGLLFAASSMAATPLFSPRRKCKSNPPSPTGKNTIRLDGVFSGFGVWEGGFEPIFIQQSTGLLFAASSMAATPLFSPRRKCKSNPPSPTNKKHHPFGWCFFLVGVFFSVDYLWRPLKTTF